MSKKIVISPVFCEAHLVKYQIENIVNTIDPDYIIYNEGMFPRGPESSTAVDKSFLDNYTLDGRRGFDYQEMKSIVDEANGLYDTNIILHEMNYPLSTTDASQCYYNAVSNFEEFMIDIEPGDYIFPFEGDVFHLESAKDEIQGYMDQLEPNTGFKSNWIDFIGNQYYCERSTLKPFLDNKEGRHRKICIRYGTEEFYKDVVLNFVSQKYPMLYPTDLVTYHYCWWRPGKYKQLRYDQLNRPREYWERFDRGLDQINDAKNFTKQDIVIRPDRAEHLTSRYAAYWEGEHPEAIKKHPNWIDE